MMKNELLPIMLLVLASSGAAQSDAVDSGPPPYSDEQGEEVFGPNYLPAGPTGPSEPLKIGTPSAGAVVPQPLSDIKQSDFMQSVPPGIADGPPRSEVPLLRSVREREGLPRWREQNRRGREAIPNSASDAPPGDLTVHYVYVGQGAGAILEFPCGVAVIDSGGEYGSGDNGGKMFVDYLNTFFSTRPHLNRTIDVLFTSHPHKDHLFGLTLLKIGTGPDQIRIRNIVDNGQSGTAGSLKSQTASRDRARNAGARYSAVEVASQRFATGSTNDVIDPVKCSGIDPKLTAFWGGRNEALGSASALTDRYRTPNNHSVVVRVDYGASSLLFLGDLQLEGIADMLAEYQDNLAVFDVDVYLSSHHGAENGTSEELLRVTSPKIAVISMGDKTSTKPSTAFDHGHPRLATIRDMQDAPDWVSQTRPAKVFWGADGEEQPFKNVTIRRAIHGTGWEGTRRLRVRSDGTFLFEN
jgi:beta-lactamase superfamily II metal-dependent hydrolase